MKNIATILVALFLAACGANTTEQTADRQNTNPVVATNAQSDAMYQVKAVKGGATIVEFSQKGERPIAMLDGETVNIFLGSPDNKYHVTIEVHTTKPGTFPIVDQNGGPKQGQAGLALINEPESISMAATKGELKLDDLSEKTISGSFKATGTDGKGEAVTVEGRFTKMLARKV